MTDKSLSERMEEEKEFLIEVLGKEQYEKQLERKRWIDFMRKAELAGKDFKIPPEVAAKIAKKDELEYKARHPELFPEYNFRCKYSA
jgi:hypothetical protein